MILLIFTNISKMEKKTKENICKTLLYIKHKRSLKFLMLFFLFTFFLVLNIINFRRKCFISLVCVYKFMESYCHRKKNRRINTQYYKLKFLCKTIKPIKAYCCIKIKKNRAVKPFYRQTLKKGGM